MKSSLSFACVSAFALAVSVVLGAPSAYDDMAALRPAGGADDFWDTSRHSAVAIDVESSSSVAMDSRVPQSASAAETLETFDSRWCVAEESSGVNLYTTATGTLILFR